MNEDRIRKRRPAPAVRIAERFDSAPYETDPAGMTTAEIATRLDISETTVRVELRSAHAKLRDLLADDFRKPARIPNE
jgi:orotate phosphoribosyltransferase-like protein